MCGPLKYKGQKKTLTSVANCFQLKVAKTGHLMLLDDLIKVSSLIKSSQVTFIYIALLTIQIVSKQLHNIKMGK